MQKAGVGGGDTKPKPKANHPYQARGHYFGGEQAAMSQINQQEQVQQTMQVRHALAADASRLEQCEGRGGRWSGRVGRHDG